MDDDMTVMEINTLMFSHSLERIEKRVEIS